MNHGVANDWRAEQRRVYANMAVLLHRLAGAHLVSFFGITTLPVIIGKDEPFRFWTHSAHEALAWTLRALLAVQIAAVIEHRFVDRVADRMVRLPVG